MRALRHLALAGVLSLLAAPGLAQLVNDGETNVISGTTNIVTGDVTVGTNAPFTTLLLTSGAFLTNSGDGYIGLSGSAHSNTVWLTDSGTRWQIASNLHVGSAGSWNRLVVSNGAKVVNRSSGYLGLNAASGNNVAVVTGAGSVWSNGVNLYVGYEGSGNQLGVSNGGVVRSYEGSVGGYFGGSSTGSGNRAFVTGAGSVWRNDYRFTVGVTGSDNHLVVSSGGLVQNTDDGSIGFSGSNNLAVVTGAGSLWSNANQLWVGAIGSGNQLVVSNGGVVRNTIGYVGINSTSSNNVAVVTGAGSYWSNVNDLIIGNVGAFNTLIISNGGVVRSSTGYLGKAALVGNNVAVVTGAGSLWSNVGDLVVGEVGSGNQLLVSDGGAVRNSYGYLGDNFGGNNNVAVVAGADSTWSNNAALFVGFDSSSNRLVVSNGGTVFASNAVYLGLDSVATNNRITIDGGTLRVANVAGTGIFDIRRGTNVLNSGLIDVDQLMMTNTAGKFQFKSGTLITRGGVISNGTIPTTSTFRVGGATNATGAVWDVRIGINPMLLDGTLYVGDGSVSNCQMLITNGQRLVQIGNSGYSGCSQVQHGAKVVVAGSGSSWITGCATINEASLLVVSNGATVADYQGRVDGYFASSLAIVTGSGSLWTNSDMLEIGKSGSRNQLVVSDGGTVISGHGIIGSNSDVSLNRALVTGAGSVWSNDYLILGYQGSRNELAVSNGGTICASSGLTVSLDSSYARGNVVRNDGGNIIVTNSAGTAAFYLGNGTLIADAGLTKADSFFVEGPGYYDMISNAVLKGRGAITGPVTCYGTITPGNPTGALAINGSLGLNNGAVLAFNLGGLIANNDYGVLNVGGPVAFGGALSVTLTNGFTPAWSNRFTVMNYASGSGAFANVASGGRLAIGPSGATMRVFYNNGTLRLGDYRLDLDGDGL
ncbi:MAG TPA: hypothetical protein VI454_02330, partial [Verrucomicrobiae bacterium]